MPVPACSYRIGSCTDFYGYLAPNAAPKPSVRLTVSIPGKHLCRNTWFEFYHFLARKSTKSVDFTVVRKLFFCSFAIFPLPFFFARAKATAVFCRNTVFILRRARNPVEISSQM